MSSSTKAKLLTVRVYIRVPSSRNTYRGDLESIKLEPPKSLEHEAVNHTNKQETNHKQVGMYMLVEGQPLPKSLRADKNTLDRSAGFT